MRYVVGYTANEQGRDALNLAGVLARTQHAGLDLVLVAPEPSPYTAVYPPERGYTDLLDEQLEAWRTEALGLVPADVHADAEIRRADSDAQGLMDAAEDLDAGLIVVGAAGNSIFQRFTVGSVANALLHASSVPVALAPKGYSRTAPLTRITCGIGSRPGAQDVLDAAVEAAARSSLPLRLVSLVALDAPAGKDEAMAEASRHAKAAQAKAEALAGGRCPVSAVVAHGRTIENAIDELDFDKGEIMLIGSSRLAQNHRLFLGTTASKVLRSLPVPMVVIPRNDGAHPAGGPQHTTEEIQ
ncbi:universal stress protein [Arthrobacter sp. zg-Y750]|uniref:universal stress protein n=1 Tax=Arthrobacter sp. zg-Y750 TaxID=2894189 RepID=UPI002F424D1D|nr:universal stress protein [Arthrobacter sp. zg-Y750]